MNNRPILYLDVDGSDYWKAEMGEWEEPFTVTRDSNCRYVVECHEVRKFETITVVVTYEPIE